MGKTLLAVMVVWMSGFVLGEVGSGAFDGLWRYKDEPVKMENGLWVENPPERQFGNGRTNVVIADMDGPGVITMIHFALPAAGDVLDRSAILRIYWDGEKEPSVEVPLVEFFCDANGSFARVDNIVLNKKRGWNCYFPMPFKKHARVEIENDNPRYPMGMWGQNPCYSYVIYKNVDKLDKDTLYFHSTWRRQVWNMAKEWYEVLDAKGVGQLVGWNITLRAVDPNVTWVLPDENEYIYVDGEEEPSIEWQGIEDAFGYSWGFPEEDNMWFYMGCNSFYKTGKSAYRFMFEDRVPFAKSLYFKLGFSLEERPNWEKMFPTGVTVDCSTTAYWYQKEPHKAFGALGTYAERRPVNVVQAMGTPSMEKETVYLNCNAGNTEIAYLKAGWDFVFEQGFSGVMPQEGTPGVPCWADDNEIKFDLTCPAGVKGKLLLYIADADKLGREEVVYVDGQEMGTFADFSEGKWVEFAIGEAVTGDGVIKVGIKRINGLNAVVSKVRFEAE